MAVLGNRGGEVKVPCRRCKNQVSASKLVLDPEYRMMVCPSCIDEKKKKSSKPLFEKREPEKPMDWDKDDEYLAKAKMPARPTTGVVIGNASEEKVRVKCAKCKFSFNYHPERRIPRCCPNCGLEVMI